MPLLSTGFEIFLSQEGFEMRYLYSKIYFSLTKVALCTPEDLDCVNGIKTDDGTCLPSCEGIITGLMKKPAKTQSNSLLYDLVNDYDSYQSSDYFKIQFPTQLKGLNYCTYERTDSKHIRFRS